MKVFFVVVKIAFYFHPVKTDTHTKQNKSLVCVAKFLVVSRPP